MQKTTIADALRELAQGDKARSETARLRDVINEVEATLAAGVSRQAVLEALHNQGFTMTLKSFESALYRIRKGRTKPAKPGAVGVDPTIEAPDTDTLTQAPQPLPQTPRITNPADIRKARRRDIDLNDFSSDKE